MSEQRVAIVGMAALFPGAADLSQYWSNIESGVDAIREVPPRRLDPAFFREDLEAPDPARFYCRRGGFVDDDALFDPVEFGIMPVVVEGTEPDQMIALRAAAAALADAGDGALRIDRSRIGVILGRGGYLTAGQLRLNEWVRTAEQMVVCLEGLLPDLSPAQLAAVRTAFRAKIGAQRPEAAIGIVPNLAASRIANRLDLGGPAYLVDAACASSLIAIDHALSELASGRCDLVLAGGVHHCHDTTLWSLFTQLGAVSPSQQSRPFDRRADGLLIGEGTGIVVLRRLADAERDGDRIYAVIRGCGLASDGRESSLMNPRVGGQVLALERAYRAAHVDPASIGLIEAHGTATPAGDDAEIETIARFFGPVENGRRAGIGSVKSMIGHAMPAAGMAGLIKAALAIHHGVLPPTLHCEEPLPRMSDTRFWPIAKAEPWETRSALRRAGVNAFGFGGVNAHVVLESHGSARPAHRAGRAAPIAASAREAAPEGAAGVWVFAGDDAADLLAQLEAAQARGAPGPLPAQPGPARLAIADPSPRRIGVARTVLSRGRPWRGRNDVWFSDQGLLREGGQLAFVFPGIEPEHPPELSDIAAALGLPSPDVSSGDIEARGFAVVAAGRFLARAMREVGVVPDLITGHSIGEWSGMIASELVPPSAVDDFIASLERNRFEVPDVAYLAAGCSVDVARAVIDGVDGAALSHDNCPHQAIICGRSEALALVRQRLRERRVLADELSFRSGFHSPFFAPYLERYRDVILRTPTQAPAIPLWSSITCEPYPADPAAVADVVCRFHLEPVRFRELIQRLYAEGVRVFVQLGIGSTMHFTSDTLRAEPHMGVSLLEPGRSPLLQLRRAAAALFVEGADIDVARVIPAPDAPVARATTRRPAPLVLGSNLVRFSEPLALRAAPAGAPAIPSGRIGEELAAVLRDASDASRRVAEQWMISDETRRHVGPARAPASRGLGSPVLEPRRRRERRTLSLETVPELYDHCLFPQPEWWPDVSDCFPIAPMTMMVAMMGEAAERLVPELRVVGFEGIVARRWLEVAPPVEVEIDAHFDGTDRVRVTLDKYARGTVRVARRYPEPPGDVPAPLEDARECPVSRDEIYRDRWMFHGPEYQGVDQLTREGRNGIDAVLRALPAPGALLDSAGQLIGLWVILHTDADRLALPYQIERIDLYGPPPASGTRVACSVRVVTLAQSGARSNMDLRVDGRLIMRVHGWEQRRFESTERSYEVFMRPWNALLAEPGRDMFVVVRQPWHTTRGRDLLMRRYLSAEERRSYAKVAPRSQSEWLLTRIAVKDAVRRWLFGSGHSEVYPVQVKVRTSDSGELLVSGPFDADLRVAVAAERGVAVALVSVGHAARIQLGDGPLGGGDPSCSLRESRIHITNEEDRVVRFITAGPG